MKVKEMIVFLEKLNPETEMMMNSCEEIDSIRLESWEHWRDGEKVKDVYVVIYSEADAEDNE
ncbi:MAG: hypothetical protein K0M69_15895 [Youngiibacter sp.]|nr:hypothetical protein [Youngiibacter sp.]